MIKVLGNRIAIRPLPKDEKASGSIYYAPSHTPEQQFAVVVAVGTGRLLKNGTIVEIPVKVGDTVLIDQYAIQSKTDAGDGSWIIDMSACSLVVQPLVGMVQDT